MGSAFPAGERSGRPLLNSKGSVFNQKIALHQQTKNIMQFSRACLLTSTLVSLSTALPATGVLRSQLPEKPIENPANWAWGQHPRNGLGYNAKDDLELEVCLANPHMIATPKCKVPLDICLDNPQWLPLVGCSGNQYPVETCTSMPSLLSLPSCDFTFPLNTCTANPKLFTLPQCSANLTPKICATTPSITTSPVCSDALDGYQPDLFTCQDNKEALCSLGLCEKHKFIVKC